MEGRAVGRVPAGRLPGTVEGAVAAVAVNAAGMAAAGSRDDRERDVTVAASTTALSGARSVGGIDGRGTS